MPVMDFKPRVKGEVERIEGSEELSARDKELLLDYKRDMKIEGLSHSRIYKVLIHTRKLAEQLDGVSLDEASEEDIKDLMEWIRDRELAPATTSDYKGMIKRFYKWLNGGEEYPEKVRWITTTQKEKDRKLPQKLLDEDEVERMIEATKNLRDPALIAVLWESGARPGEVLDMRVGDFEDRKHGKKVVIDGKTGPRRLPLVSSVPHLSVWLNRHPQPDNQDAHVWCRLKGYTGEGISHEYTIKVLKRIAERAGVDKPVNPYQFRHSRATYLANRFTEAQMCEYFGWKQGSGRPATYVHLCGRDIDSAYDKMHGFDEEKERRSEFSPRECPRCGEMNQGGAKWCQKCGLPLDADTAERLKEEEEIAEKLYDRDAKVEGNMRDLVNSMVEKKLEEILGLDYGEILNNRDAGEESPRGK